MKKVFMFAAFAALLTTGCRKIEIDDVSSNNGGSNPPPTSENTILEGRITANRTLSAQYTYKLRGLVYVTNGAILTIEPGTMIVGEAGTANKGGLIITRSCR